MKNNYITIKKYNKIYKYKLLNYLKNNYKSNTNVFNDVSKVLFNWMFKNHEIYLYIDKNDEILG